MADITTEQFWSLSPQDRDFYLRHKDDMEMCVVNGKLHYKVYNNKPYVTWGRFQEFLQLKDSLTVEEDEILHIYTDFNDWNRFGRPYAEYGFYYNLHITASSYYLDKLGIDKPVKDWLADWLLGHGFSADEVATVCYCGGTSCYTKEEGYSETKSYGIEIRCRFCDIPAHWVPQKVHRWVKRNKGYKDVVFGR